MSGIDWTSMELSESELVAVLGDGVVWRDQDSDVRFACNTEERNVVLHFPEPAPANARDLQTLLELANLLGNQRAAAPPLVNQLMEMDPATWRPLIAGDPAYRSIGVVEGLLAAVAKTQHLTTRCFELTTLACEIVQILDQSWPPLLRANTTAEVLREHALALHNLGRYPAAKEAAQRSAAILYEWPTLAHERALTDYVLAMVLQRLGENTEALACCRRAALIFRDHGDKQRYVKARLWEGVALYHAGRTRESARLWTSLMEHARALHDRVTLAWLYNNIGNAFRQEKRFGQATWYLRQAVALFEALGITHELPRIKLAMARMEMQKGRFEHALPALHEARRGFAECHNGAGVAGVDLDIVELLILTSRFDEAKELCSGLPTIFMQFGLTTSALEAAAFLREVAAHDALVVSHVEHVREFLRDLPENPRRPFIRPIPEAGG